MDAILKFLSQSPWLLLLILSSWLIAFYLMVHEIKYNSRQRHLKFGGWLMIITLLPILGPWAYFLCDNSNSRYSNARMHKTKTAKQLSFNRKGQ